MSVPMRRPLPLILIRGFGGFNTDDEKKLTYQGFNDGSVYPNKQGENYIYEGMLLRFIKSDWRYQDATNVVGYYSRKVESEPVFPRRLQYLKDQNVINKFDRLKEAGYFSGDKIIINPAMALHLIESTEDPCRSIWVFRYYDLNDRKFATYGKALVRLIDFIRELAMMQDGVKPKVNIIAHSMGGLIVREAVQRSYPEHENGPLKAEDYINKIVTLGTPHRGVTFQVFKYWMGIAAEDDFKHFNPRFQADATNPASYKHFKDHFPPERLLTVVGTNYRSYAPIPATALNQFFSEGGEYGPNYNRSDGLVKQISAEIPGAVRTFINKCHGGYDSLITSRESFEVATRFLFGNVRSRLRLVNGKITRGKDWFGKSEFFLGVSIKPRGVDFELFHQSKEAENCYGPFSEVDPLDKNVDFRDKDIAFPWADHNKLIWEGYLDTRRILEDDSIIDKDMVLRLDFYVGERDLLGIGFSDNLIFRKQYYIRALIEKRPLELYLHTTEGFDQPDSEQKPKEKTKMIQVNDGWEFDVQGTGFEGTFRIEIDSVPEEGEPIPFI